jgi:hypothetical protein
MRRTRAENAAFVISSVEALGLKLDPASRLIQMYRVLTQAQGTIARDDPRFPAALEAERDMQLLGFVFDQSNPHRARSDFKAVVKRMLHDSVLPQHDRGESEGRDSQFELFIAAVCQSAGLIPVDYEEPDMTCMVQGIKFGIAAKRLKSVTNLDKRVKKAAQQIGRASLPDIVALDTCIALNRDNERITTPIADERFGRLYSEAMRQFVHEYHERIYRWVVGKGVRGIVFHDHQVRFVTDGDWELASMTYWLPTAHEDGPASRQYSWFHDAYLKGLPNLRDVSE